MVHDGTFYHEWTRIFTNAVHDGSGTMKLFFNHEICEILERCTMKQGHGLIDR